MEFSFGYFRQILDRWYDTNVIVILTRNLNPNRGRYKVTITDDNGVDKEIQEYNNNGSFGELGKIPRKLLSYTLTSHPQI